MVFPLKDYITLFNLGERFRKERCACGVHTTCTPFFTDFSPAKGIPEQFDNVTFDEEFPIFWVMWE